MYCTRCGTGLPDGSAFCENCGAPLSEEATGERAAPSHPGGEETRVLSGGETPSPGGAPGPPAGPEGEPSPGRTPSGEQTPPGGEGEAPVPKAPPSPDTVLVGSPPGKGKTPSPDTVLLGRGKDGSPGEGEDLPASFGRYRVLRELGRGAMGVVYLARDDRIGRNVAVKALRIPENLPEDEKREIRERFEREARAAGMLSHPNIVTVHDVGEEGGTPFMAMEYLQGATLSEIMAEGPLSIEQATSIITQVLSALAYAHGHEVVHRDIKPDNAFLLPDGRVKVADFGIARISSSSTMTQVGQVMGTPGYMSPEQVKGEPVGPASDIFSCGVLLYELLTGEPAFSSGSPTSVMYRIVHEQPPAPHLINPAVPPYLEAVISRACEKDPSSRYGDASQMKRDIDEARAPLPREAPLSREGTVLRATPLPAGAVPPPVSTPAPARRRTALWAGIGTGVFILAAGVAVALVLILSGGGLTLEIESPRKGETVSGPRVEVSLRVSDPERVDRVEVYLDNVKKATLTGSPFETEIPDVPGGPHEITASAYADGVRLADAPTISFQCEGVVAGGPTGDYKTDFSSKITEANNMHEQIKGYANRINRELDHGGVSAGLMAELRDLLNRAVGLEESVKGMEAPGEYADIDAEFIKICGYLRVRAEALVRGSESYNAHGKDGNYEEEFGKGFQNLNKFKNEWPDFLSKCRARGIGI